LVSNQRNVRRQEHVGIELGRQGLYRAVRGRGGTFETDAQRGTDVREELLELDSPSALTVDAERDRVQREGIRRLLHVVARIGGDHRIVGAPGSLPICLGDHRRESLDLDLEVVAE